MCTTFFSKLLYTTNIAIILHILTIPDCYLPSYFTLITLSTSSLAIPIKKGLIN